MFRDATDAVIEARGGLSPFGYRAGDENLYRFVEDDPVNHTDPSGLSPTGGAKGAIDAMVDKLHWPDDKKARIKEQLHKMIDTAQFPWFRPIGPVGKCHEWDDEFYPKIKGMLPGMVTDGISVSRKEWKVNDVLGVGGHAAVTISVSDAPNSLPDNSFKLYLDDGWLGRDDHVFVDAEVPAKWTHSAGYPWQGGNEKLQDCAVRPQSDPVPSRGTKPSRSDHAERGMDGTPMGHKCLVVRVVIRRPRSHGENMEPPVIP